MNAESFPYPHARQLTIAGCLTLVTLATAVIYACHANPFTMVLFLGLGSTLLMAAVILFGWSIWKDLRAQLDGIASKQFAPGDVIFRPGDPADHVFVIAKGHVEAVHTDPAKGDIILARLGPEEYFGETAILSCQPRQITARAVDAVEVLAIPRTDFLRLYSTLPRLRYRLEAQQAHRTTLARHAGLKT